MTEANCGKQKVAKETFVVLPKLNHRGIEPLLQPATRGKWDVLN